MNIVKLQTLKCMKLDHSLNEFIELCKAITYANI